MPEQKPSQVLKLWCHIVRKWGGKILFFPVEDYTYVRLLNHGNVVDTVTDSQGLSFSLGVVYEELNYSSFLVGVSSVNNDSMA